MCDTGGWTLAFEQRTDLSTAHGSAAAVADALRRGADLRLYMTTDRYEETLYFQQTYVRLDGADDGGFAGLMSHHHSYTHRGGPAEQPYVSLFRYDTSGRYEHLKWMVDNRTLDEGQAYAYGTYRWFVCGRWRLAYAHDAECNPTAGSLDDLRQAVRAGRTIRVGVEQLFGMASDHAAGPAHLSFLTTLQLIIEDGQVLSNCDFALVGAPTWPIAWADGVHLAMLRPSTSGEITCYLTPPGALHFRRSTPRRAMRWLVAEAG